MAIREITSADFEEVVLKAEKPVLVDFNATWCGPCRMLKPALEEVAAQRTDVEIVGVDIDENMFGAVQGRHGGRPQRGSDPQGAADGAAGVSGYV